MPTPQEQLDEIIAKLSPKGKEFVERILQGGGKDVLAASAALSTMAAYDASHRNGQISREQFYDIITRAIHLLWIGATIETCKLFLNDPPDEIKAGLSFLMIEAIPEGRKIAGELQNMVQVLCLPPKDQSK